MFTVTKYPQGTFSWADCTTTDTAAGKQFYAELMGWEIADFPMGPDMGDMVYTMFMQDGQAVAALAGMPPGMPEMPPFWNNYVTVDDVDAMAEKVVAAGGSINMGPMDVFDNGRMLSVMDPTGANLMLWQPRSHIGAGLVNTPGALCWNELYTRDAEAAKAFYGELLGWSFMADPNNPGYSMIQNKGRMNGGIFTMDDEMSAVMPPMWMPYFSVADIEAAAERVVELGGTVFIGPQAAGEVGTFILFTDPQGAHCYLIQLREPEAWVE